MAEIPRRPAWRDSDPRWRRRVLAGMWVLVLVPLMDVLTASGWAEGVSVPAVFEFGDSPRTLDETFLSDIGLYPSVVFCIGVVLLFSNERGRRRGRLEWTRRSGVVCSYVVFLLNATQVLAVAALVLLGIAGVFLSIPPRYQPAFMQIAVDVSTGWLRYGPQPKEIAAAVQVAFSSIAILLACVPLFDALRSTAPKWVAASLLAPLAAFALMHLAHAGLQCLGTSGVTELDVYPYGVYFWPHLLVRRIAGLPVYWLWGSVRLSAFVVEAAKWSAVLAIAVWLTLARFGTIARPQRRRDASTS